MTDQEISRRLALAIGWKKTDVKIINWPDQGLNVYVFGGYKFIDEGEAAWRKFDYRDWGVLGPIAARYNAFPQKWTVFSPWQASTGLETDRPGYEWHKADTPERAVALAVIAAAEKGVLK